MLKFFLLAFWKDLFWFSIAGISISFDSKARVKNEKALEMHNLTYKKKRKRKKRVYWTELITISLCVRQVNPKRISWQANKISCLGPACTRKRMFLSLNQIVLTKEKLGFLLLVAINNLHRWIFFFLSIRRSFLYSI